MTTTQVQCPHCSGFRVKASEGLIKNDSGKRVSASSWGIGSIMLFLLAPVLLIGGIIESFKEWPDNSGFGPCGIVSGAILLAIMVLKIVLTNKQAENTHKAFFFKCELCGKEWQVRQGDPLPPLENQINPSLATLGAKKLEEEEAEAERRRQEEAAADAFLRSQDK